MTGLGFVLFVVTITKDANIGGNTAEDTNGRSNPESTVQEAERSNLEVVFGHH